MKRELNQGMLTKNGVAAKVMVKVIALVYIELYETPPNVLYGFKSYWRLNFWMHQDSTSSIAKNAKFNLN